MTRPIVAALLAAVFCLPLRAAAQTFSNPAAKSAYAPRTAAAPSQAEAPRTYGPQIANPQPVEREAAPVRVQARGPQVFGQQPLGQPVRQVSGEAPLRQPTPGGSAAAPQAAPQPPEWFPLDPAHEKWVNDILLFWEQKSSKIKTFECNFTRWDYEPVFVPATHAKTISSGVIKYAQPDKGLYRVEKLLSYSPPAKTGDEPQYLEQDKTLGEHWVCDGKQIFAFDAVNKKMIVSSLPPNMQGRAIVDGPLPFMFGAKAETIKARYWLRGVEGGQAGKYHLEAVPKSRADAQNFKMIQIVLDGDTFLPEWLLLFAPNYTEKMPVRSTLKFDTIAAKDDDAILDLVKKGLDPLKLFHKEFYAPATPKGWKRVVENAAPLAAAPAENEADREARQPQNRPLRPLSLPK